MAVSFITSLHIFWFYFVLESSFFTHFSLDLLHPFPHHIS